MTTGSRALEAGVGFKGRRARDGRGEFPTYLTLPYYVNTRNGQTSKTDLGYIYFVGALTNSRKVTLEVGSQPPRMREAASACSMERIEARSAFDCAKLYTTTNVRFGPCMEYPPSYEHVRCSQGCRIRYSFRETFRTI
jgi:hypothetical protein